jgi:nitrite reductase/ring-hydroxylating ferredoxin subunit
MIHWIPLPIPEREIESRLYAVDADGQPVVLLRLEGRWLAFADTCPHAGCALSADGELDGAILICNCHGSEFDLPAGEVRRGPAQRPLIAFSVRLTEDGLEIGFEERRDV